MGWQNIGEGIVSSILGTLIFNLIFQNVNKGHNREFKLSFPKDPFLISLSITIFFGILSLFGFYYDWQKFPYLMFITFGFGFLSAIIHNEQCPECKRLFVKLRHNPTILKEEKRPYIHHGSTTYLYRDGSFKNRKMDGNKQTFMETIRTQHDNFSCKKCGHEWKSKVYERNLDIKNRPKNNVVRTRFRNPDENSLSAFD